MFALIAGVLIAVQPPIGTLTGRITCFNSLAVNTSYDGKDNHGDQISSRRPLFAKLSGAEFLGYEYQTYGGREFIEFSIFPRSLFPFHGSVFAAFQRAPEITGTSQSAMLPPFDRLTPDTQFLKATCK